MQGRRQFIGRSFTDIIHVRSVGCAIGDFAGGEEIVAYPGWCKKEPSIPQNL